MICASCRAGNHAPADDSLLAYLGPINDGCSGGTWCDCQHRSARVAVITPDGEATGMEVLLGVHAPEAVCICLEQVDGAYGRFAVPPPAGCPTHGHTHRWVGASLDPAPDWPE